MLNLTTLDNEMRIIEIFKQIFSFRIMFPFLISLFLVLSQAKDFYFIILFLLYILLNRNDMFKIKNTLIQLIKNPNAVNI